MLIAFELGPFWTVNRALQLGKAVSQFTCYCTATRRGYVQSRKVRHTSKSTCPQSRSHHLWFVRGDRRRAGGSSLVSACGRRFRYGRQVNLSLRQGNKRSTLWNRDTLCLQSAPPGNARDRVGAAAWTTPGQPRS